MSVVGFSRMLFMAALIASLSGCAQLERKGPLHAPERTDDAKSRRQTGPESEGRAVWIHSTYFSQDRAKAASEIEEQLDTYAGIGIDNLFCFHALRDQHGLDWDFLEVLLQEAHSRGMKVHPCFCVGHLYPAWKEEVIEQHPDWLIRSIKESRPSLNLALPEVREFIISQVSEALRYDIDGIHLDYIRFQTGQGFSYDDATCQAFKQRYGRGPLELSWHNCGSVIWCEWMRWNAAHVTDLVRGIREEIEKSARNIPLSAAVFPDHESAKLLVGQDWRKWAEEGLVDILCPMLYTKNNEVFEKYARYAVDVAKGKCLVYTGIAIVTSHAENTPQRVAEQIQIARRAGADGVALFSASSLKGEFIRELKGEVFKQK